MKEREIKDFHLFDNELGERALLSLAFCSKLADEVGTPACKFLSLTDKAEKNVILTKRDTLK